MVRWGIHYSSGWNRLPSIYWEAWGRHKACPYGGGAGVGTPVAVSTGPIVHDGRAYDGGRCGGSPPAQGRAEGPTAQLQWSVIRGQWSEGTALALLGDPDLLQVSRYLRSRKVHPQSGLTRPNWRFDKGPLLCYSPAQSHRRTFRPKQNRYFRTEYSSPVMHWAFGRLYATGPG